jgi:hypothetical protein
VIAKYRASIVRQPALMAALHELRGKDLVCWCAPERCHAEVLIELAYERGERAGPPRLQHPCFLATTSLATSSSPAPFHPFGVGGAHGQRSPSCQFVSPRASHRAVTLCELATEMSKLKGSGRLLKEYLDKRTAQLGM